MGDSDKEKDNSLPDFKNMGRFEGNIPVLRQLTRLTYDFKKAGQSVPKLELFLEAIEMLLKGEPARCLNSIPRIRKLIDNRASANEANIETIKEWLMEEFLTLVDDVTEINV